MNSSQEQEGQDPKPALVSALTTEHFALQATRSSTVMEANGRSQLFLSALTGAVVALALVAELDELGRTFTVFALSLLPAVLALGLTTYVRLADLAVQDAFYARAIGRIRVFYLTIEPSARHLLGATGRRRPTRRDAAGRPAAHDLAPPLARGHRSRSADRSGRRGPLRPDRPTRARLIAAAGRRRRRCRRSGTVRRSHGRPGATLAPFGASGPDPLPARRHPSRRSHAICPRPNRGPRRPPSHTKGTTDEHHSQGTGPACPRSSALHVGRRTGRPRESLNLSVRVLQQSWDWHGHLLGWGA